MYINIYLVIYIYLNSIVEVKTTKEKVEEQYSWQEAEISHIWYNSQNTKVFFTGVEKPRVHSRDVTRTKWSWASEPTKGLGKVIRGRFEGTERFHAEVGHNEVSICEWSYCHRSHLVYSPEGDLWIRGDSGDKNKFSKNIWKKNLWTVSMIPLIVAVLFMYLLQSCKTIVAGNDGSYTQLQHSKSRSRRNTGVWSHPRLHSEVQASLDYTVWPLLGGVEIMISDGKNSKKLTLAKRVIAIVFWLFLYWHYSWLGVGTVRSLWISHIHSSLRHRRWKFQASVETSVSEADSEVRVEVCTLCSNPWIILKYEWVRQGFEECRGNWSWKAEMLIRDFYRIHWFSERFRT